MVRAEAAGGRHGTTELCRALGARGWPSGRDPGVTRLPRGRPAEPPQDPLGSRVDPGTGVTSRTAGARSCVVVTSHACSCMLLRFFCSLLKINILEQEKRENY